MPKMQYNSICQSFKQSFSIKTLLNVIQQHRFLDLEPEEIDALMQSSMKRSERWRHMKYDLKKSDSEIIKSFEKPKQMTIFSWKER